jgi:hypothetical protein
MGGEPCRGRAPGPGKALQLISAVLGIKSVVVHCRGIAFDPEWEITGNLFACTWKARNKVLGGAVIK